MTSFLYYNNTTAYFFVDDYEVLDPSGVGNVVLVPTTNPGTPVLRYVISFDPADRDAPPTIIITNTANTLYLYYDETDDRLKWGSGTPTGFYIHRCSFVHLTFQVLEQISLVIWTETPTRRYTWGRVGDAIIGDASVPPATYMQTVTDSPEASPNVPGQFVFRGTPKSQVFLTQTLMPYFSNFDLLDGAFLKCATTGYFGLNVTRYEGTISTINQPGYALVYPSLTQNDSNVWIPCDTPYYPFQLRRNRDVFNVPTGSWEIWMGEYHQRLCTGSTVQTGGRVVVTEASQADFGNWVVTNFNWGIEFNDTSETISIYNWDLKENGATDYWLGEGTNDGLSPWVRLHPPSTRVEYPVQFLFAPLAYEYNRYANQEELLVQCCSSTVTEIGPPPEGYADVSANISYGIFCPTTHLPDPITSDIKTNASAVCDPLLVDWCGRAENETKSLCACINPFDAPPLPDDSLINAFKRCFSQQCRDFGYRTAGMLVPSTGQLDCPTELCTNIINIEEGSNVEFEEAKQIIDCTDEGGNGGGDTGGSGIDTMTWIYIIAGSVVAIGIIIGVSIGVSQANKNKKEQE